ncbi:hypothetical protein F0562_025233 [Nyssa sinensis]|uniref:PGG domain-containing protein n=1 Tax=Nyssa sinensis TaxID=561372 RepID=A0A5J5BG58_9ASTE|nr:hypothetical protein F0562_025233 [Nyssa sinensis]
MDVVVPCTKVKHNEKLIQTKALELLKCLWYHVIQQEDLEISDITGNISPLLFTAAELGNEVFVIELLRSYPDFVLQVNFNKQSIFHVAVLHRHKPIFNLIYEIGTLKELISTYRDNDDNNMLHLAAKLAPPNQLNAISGAALQMQRQLVWYKEVEKIVQPSYRDMKNKNGQTPHDLFTMEHKELTKEGEKWMKDTAKSCMIITTLIAIVVFLSAFVIPGGNNTKGEPILLNERFFKVYSVSKMPTAEISQISNIVHDLFVVSSAKQNSARTIKKTLEMSSNSSLACISNSPKRKIFLAESNSLSALAYGFLKGNMHATYLGVLFISTELSKRDCQPVIDKIVAKIF